jgi:elongation factor P
MLDMNALKVGVAFRLGDEPYQVTKASHLKMGRGAAVLQAKIKNIKTGSVLERNFKPSDKFEELELEKKKADYLYSQDNKSYFMDENYEQFFLDTILIENQLKFIKESASIIVLIADGLAIGLELPPKVDLKVIEAPPAVRGDTAQGSVTKTIRLETGVEINAPIFIKQEDIVRVNTETGEYVERVSK